MILFGVAMYEFLCDYVHRFGNGWLSVLLLQLQLCGCFDYVYFDPSPATPSQMQYSSTNFRSIKTSAALAIFSPINRYERSLQKASTGGKLTVTGSTL